jgi:hypothetical protein
VYRWELDGPAQQQFADLSPAARTSLAAFMDAVVIVDPVQYQGGRDERDDVSMPLRTLHFGPHDEGLVTFLVYPPGELLDVHPQDLRETHQHTMAVDTALASLDLG